MTSPDILVPDRRRLLLSPDATFNGVDFAEVRLVEVAGERREGVAEGRPGYRAELAVHFINRVWVEGTLARDRAPVTLTGGGYPPELTVRPRRDDAWSTDTSGRPVLHVTTDVPDLGSRYILTVHSDRVDPGFQSVAVTFPGPGEDALDRAVPAVTGPAPAGPVVPIDYLAKDFASFCQALSLFSAARYPLWAERSEADFGVMLMEVLSALADELSYLQDRVAAEATLDTATQRLSLEQHARLVDYEPAQAACGHDRHAIRRRRAAVRRCPVPGQRHPGRDRGLRGGHRHPRSGACDAPAAAAGAAHGSALEPLRG